MNAVNGYILYRMIRDKNEKPRRHSIMPTLSETTQLRAGRLQSGKQLSVCIDVA